MRKSIAMILVCLCGMGATTVSAQTQTMKATVSAGTTQGNIYAVVGQPVANIFTISDNEFSVGLAQAQLTKDTVYDVVTYDEPYTNNGFSLPAQTNSHIDQVYLVNGGVHHYDLLRTIYLIVCPQTVTDVQDNNITYNAVGVSGHCWTKQNLRTPVDGALTYSNPLQPSVPEEYGLLYTWSTTLNGTSAVDGYVQGLCPANWHLPTAEEVAALSTNPTSALRSTTGWFTPNNNTNSTGFTAYPAGFYNAASQRFEGFGTQTDWWMVNGTTVDGTVTSTAQTQNFASLQIPYFCNTPLIILRNPNDAVSVRCVMKNVWPN